MTPPRPRLWTVILAYALVWIVGFGASLALALRADPAAVPSTETTLPLDVLARVAHDALHTPSFLVALVGVLSATLIFFACALALLSPQPFHTRLALSIPPGRGLAVVVWSVGGTVLAGLVGLAVSLVVDARNTLVASLTPADAPLLIGLVGPFAEELFFRGAVQSRLEARWGQGGQVPAVIVTALAAALLHLDPAQIAFVFCFGIALSFLRARTGTLWPSLIAHVVNNAAWLMLAR